MGYYKELNDITFNIVEKILQNETICKLIKYNDDDPLSQPSFDTDTLLFDGVNPSFKKPDPELDKRAIINVYLYDTIPPSNGKGHRQERFYIDVICHLESQRIKGGLRQYFIMEEIDKMFNGVRMDGVSDQKIADKGAMVIRPSEWHIGYTMKYEMSNDSNVCKNR